jgi:hypothetical protein
MGLACWGQIGGAAVSADPQRAAASKAGPKLTQWDEWSSMIEEGESGEPGPSESGRERVNDGDDVFNEEECGPKP